MSGPESSPTYWHGKITMPATPWLVKRLLPEVGTALLSGQWGMLKTFTLLDLAAALVTGEPFAGYRVTRRGGVLVFAAEGAYELPKRLRGLQVCGKLPDGHQPIAWQDSCPPLLAKGALEAMVRVAVEVQQEMQERWGVPLVLIGVDTVAAAATFKDENSSAEGQQMMNVLAELARKMRCCVLGVDHFGKMVETGTRGASSKEGAADAVLALLGDRALTGKVSNCRLAVRKMRGGPTGAEVRYTAREVDLGVDRDGDPVTTMTIDWDTDAPAPKAAEDRKGKRWSKALLTLRQALLAAIAEHGKAVRPYGAEGPEVRAVDKESLRREFYAILPVDSETEKQKAEVKRKTLNRQLTAAATAGLVGLRDDDGETLIWVVLSGDTEA